MERFDILSTTLKSTAAAARVAWPQRGTSLVGVNHLKPNIEHELKDSPSSFTQTSSDLTRYQGCTLVM